MPFGGGGDIEPSVAHRSSSPPLVPIHVTRESFGTVDSAGLLITPLASEDLSAAMVPVPHISLVAPGPIFRALAESDQFVMPLSLVVAESF